MRLSQRTIFCLLLLGAVLLALAAALQMGSVARLVPLRVVLPTLFLLILQLLLDLAADQGKTIPLLEKYALKSTRSKDASANTPPGSKKAQPGWSKELPVLLWLGLLLILVLGLGFGLGAPLYAGLFFRFRARQSWLLSLATAGATLLMMQLLFVGLLDMPLPF